MFLPSKTKIEVNKQMNYGNILELDNITLEDCIELYRKKSIYAVINDGRIVNLVKKEEKDL